MNIILIRHGIAEDPIEWKRAGHDEELRPLTDAGKHKMADAAKGLAKIVSRLDVLATSPFTRAAQTAAIVAEAFKADKPVELACLSPGLSFGELTRWLQSQPADATIALVGHEPDFSHLAARWMTGQAKDIIELKKGSALLLEFQTTPRSAQGRLLWFLRPSQLRKLGE